MKLLITGGAGFIGSALVRHAIACGHDVLNVDKLTYASNLNSLGSVRDDSRYRFLQADICDGDAMRRAIADFQPDIVFNLAAETHVARDKPLGNRRTHHRPPSKVRQDWRGLLRWIPVLPIQCRISKFLEAND